MSKSASASKLNELHELLVEVLIEDLRRGTLQVKVDRST